MRMSLFFCVFFDISEAFIQLCIIVSTQSAVYTPTWYFVMTNEQ